MPTLQQFNQEAERKMKKLVFLDYTGWPVEKIKGKKFRNFVRLFLHTCEIISYKKWLDRTGVEINFN